jgi:hypothetical protein
MSFWRFSPLPHTRICRRTSIGSRETCQRRWGYPAHHLRRKLASPLRQPRCGESWRRCCASLAANAVRGPISRIFTSTYEFFLQTAGLQNGDSHCAKILSSMEDLTLTPLTESAALNSDPSDPDVIIKLDISNAFNMLCRQLTLDVLGGKDSCDYACGLKEGDNIETVCGELRIMFQYFKAMRTTKSHLRYFDYLGNVLDGQDWRTARRSPRDDNLLSHSPSLVGPDPQQAPPRRVRRGIRRRQLHQGKAVRRPRGVLGHQACTQGGRWP